MEVLPLLPSPFPRGCLSHRPRTPPSFPRLWSSTLQPLVPHTLLLQAISTQPTLSTPWNWPLEPESQNPAPTWASPAIVSDGANSLCSSLSLCFALVSLAAVIFSKVLRFPLSGLISQSDSFFPRVPIHFLFHRSLSGVLVLSQVLFVLFSLCFPFVLLSCPFWRFKVFCLAFSRCSVWIVPHADFIFVMCFWKGPPLSSCHVHLIFIN